MKTRRLWMGLLSAAAVIAGLAALPVAAAQADTCTVTVTTVSGKKLSFTVNVPAGTPLSSIPLPVKVPIESVSETCQTATSTTTTTTKTSSTHTTTTRTRTTTSTTTTRTKTTTTPAGKPKKPASPGGHSTGSRKRHPTGHSHKPSTKRTHTSKPKTKTTTSKGVPTSSNPTYSFALPGAAKIGVPNFFIDNFQIPPFLLPIYQAAGIEYDVPWQVLAAINEIETDYGRDLAVSSAGAVGWMQFLPSTWKEWGVDATGSGYADPFNPVDAIFTAARYLQAAGAAKNLAGAIFAYNHATWYVQSVLLRAQLIGGMPSDLVGALTGLVEGHFPVAAPAKYADDAVDSVAHRRVHGTNAADPIESGSDTSTAIYAKQGSPVIAVNDGKIVKVGRSAQLGRYIVLQDETGNTYTYADLGSIPALYPVPKPVRITAAQLAHELSVPALKAGHGGHPKGAASAGTQPGASTRASTSTKRDDRVRVAGTRRRVASGPLSVALAPAHTSHRSANSTTSTSASTTSSPSSTTSSPSSTTSSSTSASTGLVKERLFADPARPASFAAGGQQQLSASITNFRDYFSDVLHLGRGQYTLEPLHTGSIVVAGTILGRIGAGTQTSASHLTFMIQPAGRNAPYIDPKPILDGWKLLEATAIYRAAGVDPFFGSGAKSATVGQVLLMSKEQLTNRVLADPHVKIYACGRRDIQAGLIDRRILAVIEYLSTSGLDPTVSGLACGAGSNGIDAAGRSGASVDISAINGISIQGHQGPGSITDITIRRLLSLQGAMAPTEIISDTPFKGQPNALALPDHANRIQISYTPFYGTNKRLSSEVTQILKPKQWIQLIDHIGQIPEPSVPTSRSKYAIKDSGNG